MPSDEQSLDDKITIYERVVLAPSVAALRETPAGPIDSHVAAAVVVHLSIRSAFIRGSLSATATEMLGHFSDSMRNDQTARAVLEVDSLTPGSKLAKAIKEELLSQLGTVPESGRNALAKLMHFRAREKFPKMFPDLAATFQRQLGMLLEEIPKLIVSGHSKALDHGMAPALRVERLKEMNWQIIAATAPIHFVLPDCLAVGSKTSDFQSLEPYPFLSDDEIAGIVMPINSSKVLVGCLGKPEIDIASLNRSFARCSMEFFISSQADAQTAEVAALIGSTVSQYVDRLVSKQTFAAPEGSVREPHETEDLVQEAIKVPIKFEPSSRKSRKAQTTIQNLMSAPELQLGLRIVESIIVSDDIVLSLRQRGVTLNSHAAQDARQGACYTAETKNGLTCQLFVTTESVKLAAKGQLFAHPASVLIRHQAGRAAYYATVASKISLEALQRERPMLEATGMRIAHLFLSHYFGVRLSEMGCISGKEFTATDDLYNWTLTECAKGISDARHHFIEHRDADAALGQALGHVELLLNATANVCATTRGEVNRWKGTKSIETLQSSALSDWFELFSIDLERFFDSRNSLTDDSDLILLGSHLERVLWSFGIAVSTRSPAQIWMDVLSDEQLEQIRIMLRS